MELRNRNIATQILLSVVTCSVMLIIWDFQMAKDVIAFKGDAEDKGTLETLLMIFFPALGFFFTEKKFAAACEERGIEHKDNSILYLILGFIPFGIGYCINASMMQGEFNKLNPEVK